MEYKWVSDSQYCGEVWGSRLSRTFLHKKSGIPISRMYVILFSILSHISRNFSYYYAGIILDAHESLLCSKLCQHNVDNPTGRVYFWWRHHFQIASFSPSTLENSVFKKHRFQIAALWTALLNGLVIVFSVVVWTIAVSPFSFENGLMCTGPETWWKHAQKVVRFRCIRSNGNASKCFCDVSVYRFLEFRPVTTLIKEFKENMTRERC